MTRTDQTERAVEVIRPDGGSRIVLVCEHASRHIPDAYGDLGLSEDARASHIAWDPGALAVADGLSRRLDAVLIAGRLSRLIYDCNRPPEAPDAMPVRSEVFDVPGNVGLSDKERQARAEAIYVPFHDAVAAQLATRNAVLVTIHSFTPVYHGQKRTTEIGILHDEDARLADAMLALEHGPGIDRNSPYGPQDGVTHSLRKHALPAGLPNVMIEIRNDLIATEAQQEAMAERLHRWLTRALERLP